MSFCLFYIFRCSRSLCPQFMLSGIKTASPSAEKLQELTLPSWPLCSVVPPRDRNPPVCRSHSFKLLSHDAVQRKCPLSLKQQLEMTLPWLLKDTRNNKKPVFISRSRDHHHHRPQHNYNTGDLTSCSCDHMGVQVKQAARQPGRY